MEARMKREYTATLAIKRVLHHAPEVGEDRPLADERRPELVRGGVLQPVRVANRDGIAEVFFLDEVVDRLLGDVRRDPEWCERIAGDGHEREEEEACGEKHHDAVEQPAHDVLEHGPPRFGGDGSRV
jgi:hypothetical protein